MLKMNCFQQSQTSSTASLRSSQAPTPSKSAVVTLLLKKATLDPDILKRYRPVGKVSLVSKVLGKDAAQRLTSYMTDNNLHEYLQSVYKPGHSKAALLKVQNDINILLLTFKCTQGCAILYLRDSKINH